MTILICTIVGYLVGSIPTAYLFVRIKSGIDLRFKGSGNIGALNVYAVTQSKGIGIVVGLIDGLKGFLAAWLAWHIFGSFWIQAITFFAAIVGHNYPIWLRFHGGQGLATAAGGTFAIGIGFTIVWCLSWFAFFKTIKDILRANLAAIVVTPVIMLVVPSAWINLFLIHEIPVTDYRFFSFILSGILCLRHIGLLKEIITGFNFFRSK